MHTPPMGLPTSSSLRAALGARLRLILTATYAGSHKRDDDRPEGQRETNLQALLATGVLDAVTRAPCILIWQLCKL